MPTIDPSRLERGDRHRLLIGGIVPRPIAWITTVSEDGLVNLAPFSFFTGVTSTPPTLAVSIGHRDPPKDTLANLRATGEGVVHLVRPGRLDEVNQTGAAYAGGVSEVEELGLETTPSEVVRPPRLVDADVALECRLLRVVPVGEPPASLCLLEILRAHVDDAVAGEGGLPDPRRLRAVARLGGRAYLGGEDWIVHERPAPVAPVGKERA